MNKRLIILVVLIGGLIYPLAGFCQPGYLHVCVDPGHGGPGATKYEWNGENHGSYGQQDSLSEQWINLQVGLILRDLIQQPGFLSQNVIMIRETEQAENMPADYLQRMWYRVNLANHANYGTGVYWFISTHHNGFMNLAQQGTEAYWSSKPETDSGQARATDNKLANKILLKLLNAWGYQNRCSLFCSYRDIRCCDSYANYFVLRNTRPISALSEASDISYHWYEEDLFDDPFLAHEEQEANAIYTGWRSYVNNGGIARIENRWIGGGDGVIMIDEVVRNSPYVTCWEAYEHHGLRALDGDYFGGYLCWFHHWKEEETGNIWLSTDITVNVPSGESTHTYIAYFKGGPYEANLFMPDGGEEWIVGDADPIIWAGLGLGTSLGVDSTTLIDVFLDRNSGNGGYPEILFTDLPRKDYPNVAWLVTGPASTKCRIKIVAHDCVDNTATDVSTYNFTIRFPNISGDVNCDGKVSLSDIVYLINYLFKFGPGFEPFWKGDTNGDCKVSSSDIVWLINYLFKSGPAPVCDDSCWTCMR